MSVAGNSFSQDEKYGSDEGIIVVHDDIQFENLDLREIRI